MKNFKKVLAVLLCLTLFASLTSMSMFASATEGEEETTTEESTTEETVVPGAELTDLPESVEGVRWFPAHPDRHNDYLWEVEYDQNGCMCQSFLYDPDTNYLDLKYNEDNSLTATIKIDANGEGANYWPRIRTFAAETYPQFDMTKANTFYFDFVVAPGTQCNVLIQQMDMPIKLSAAIAKAAGVSGVANSDADLPAGHYKGSFNIYDAFADIAKETGTEASVFAQYYADTAAENLKVPQISIFVVGQKGASVTMNSLYISTPSDKNGEKCAYADAGMVMGKEAAAEQNKLMAEGKPEEEETTTQPVATTTPAPTTTTTAAADAKEKVYLLPVKDADGEIATYYVLALENGEPTFDASGAYKTLGEFDEKDMDENKEYVVVEIDDKGVIQTNDDGTMKVTPYEKEGSALLWIILAVVGGVVLVAVIVVVVIVVAKKKKA